eukprot:TRINITY_DN4123_c0_g1_i3.p1 TRINITY_DN4123_c0_g1~~TRINITY_DN4123_c0_g1_i3.p1  ORF type:complete len:213 (+),score=26.73 TRINITY_DN4123_c0_g1_i3:89-640(+)
MCIRDSSSSQKTPLSNASSGRGGVPYFLHVESNFLASLTTEQLIKLTNLQQKLKQMQSQVYQENPVNVVLNSDFYQSLNNLQINAFLSSNPHIFDAVRTRGSESGGRKEYLSDNESKSPLGTLEANYNTSSNLTPVPLNPIPTNSSSTSQYRYQTPLKSALRVIYHLINNTCMLLVQISHSVC